VNSIVGNRAAEWLQLFSDPAPKAGQSFWSIRFGVKKKGGQPEMVDRPQVLWFSDSQVCAALVTVARSSRSASRRR
jgi:hypothetical protein